jgi:hypothetical protein
MRLRSKSRSRARAPRTVAVVGWVMGTEAGKGLFITNRVEINR